MKVYDILDFLNQKFPLDTACDFDNVGLLVGNGNDEVKLVLLCLDCEKSAVQKAKELGANLIITHHPVIFDGLKSVTEDSVVFDLIKSGISVISMHTNLDVAKGGVTETLCRVLGIENIKDYVCHDGFLIRSGTVGGLLAPALAEKIKNALGCCVRFNDNGKPINNVLVCSGSGGDFLIDAKQGGFDALICADVKHNIFIDAINSDVCVFDAGHYASENVILPVLCELLRREFSGLSVESHNLKTLKSV